MQILIGAVGLARVIRLLAPGLAAILRLEQRALLDRGEEMLRIARIERQHLGVRDMRRRREGPGLVLLRADRRLLGPALAEIAALEERGGLGAGQDGDAASLFDGGERVHVLEAQALAARFPVAAVHAPEHAIAM